MTVADTIKQVKWCIDHETTGFSKLQDNGEDTYMDNIIRAKINDARRWVAAFSGQYASLPSSQKEDIAVTLFSASPDINDVGVFTVPDGINAADIKRVRLSGWFKAAVPVADTDDDALMMFDADAKGTPDRPLAVVMNGSPVKVLVQPYALNSTVELSYTGVASDIEVSGDSDVVDVSGRLQTAFVYYIAYLLLTAYGDARAQAMLAVAMQSLGRTDKQQ